MTLDQKNYSMALKMGAKATIPGGVDIENGKGVDSNVSNGFSPFFIYAVQETIAAATGGAISVATHMTDISTDAGGDAFTLADGTIIGQVKYILLTTDGGGDAVITPATFADGTTITMADAGDYAYLGWTASGWVSLELGNRVDGVTKPVVA